MLLYRRQLQAFYSAVMAMPIAWVDRGHFPLLFEVEILWFPLLFRGRHFCANAYGIHWMIGAIFVKLYNCCHQMSDFVAKMH